MGDPATAVPAVRDDRRGAGACQCVRWRLGTAPPRSPGYARTDRDTVLCRPGPDIAAALTGRRPTG